MTELHTDPAHDGSTIDPGRPLVGPAAIRVLDRVLRARPATVFEVRAETPTIVSLRLEKPAGFEHRPGQFAMLGLATPAGPDIRPLSLASAPHRSEVRFATRRGSSPFKKALVALRPGDQVKVSRALGSLTLDRTRPAVLVAGGIGVAPVLAMVEGAAASRDAGPLRLLLSNRTEEETPFREELEELSRVHPDMRVDWVVTSEAGRITPEHLRRHIEELPDAVFYVTGPALMVTDVVASLRGAGVPRGRIRLSKQTLPFPPQRSG